MRARTSLALVGLVLVVPLAEAGALTEAESRGKRIYVQGVGAAGRAIPATMGDDGAEVSAAVVSCSSCHGRDGRGRAESGVVPSDIRWEILSKPYRVNLAGGRSRGPYDDAVLIRAIALGIDSGGHRLNRAMPRFRLSLDEAADLIAYLKRLGASSDPGVESASVRIGMMLPPESAFLSAPAIRSATQSFFDRLNRSGGIYGRKIDLRTAVAPSGAAGLASALRRFVDEEGLFALVNTYVAGAEQEVATYTAASEIPLAGAFTLYPAVEPPLNPSIFYLDGGLPGQVDALAAYAASQADATPAVALVFGDAEPWRNLARLVKRQHPELQWIERPVEIRRGQSLRAAARVAQLARLVEELARQGTAYTLVLLPAPLSAEFWKAAEAARSWSKVLLVASDLISPESFDLLKTDPRAIFALPGTPSEVSPEAAVDYRSLALEYHLPHDHVAAQLTALAACRILQEGLVRSGHELSRAGLVEALEALYRFPTGFARTVTYGPNSRVGDSSGYLVRFDPASGTLTPVTRRGAE